MSSAKIINASDAKNKSNIVNDLYLEFFSAHITAASLMNDNELFITFLSETVLNLPNPKPDIPVKVGSTFVIISKHSRTVCSFMRNDENIGVFSDGTIRWDMDIKYFLDAFNKNDFTAGASGDPKYDGTLSIKW